MRTGGTGRETCCGILEICVVESQASVDREFFLRLEEDPLSLHKITSILRNYAPYPCTVDNTLRWARRAR